MVNYGADWYSQKSQGNRLGSAEINWPIERIMAPVLYLGAAVFAGYELYHALTGQRTDDTPRYPKKQKGLELRSKKHLVFFED